jgi:hypothetical protein
LLSGPFCRRMGRDGEVENAPPLMRQHQKYIEERVYKLTLSPTWSSVPGTREDPRCGRTA